MNRWVATQRARLAGDEDGSVLVFTGLVLAVLFAVAAVAVDLGRLAVTSRDQQGATDRAALDGLLALQQRGESGDAGLVATSAGLSLDRNTGSWAAFLDDIGGAYEVRPVTCGPGPGEVHTVADGAWGDPDVTGVEVVTTSEVGSLFLPGTAAQTVVRRAVACSTPLAAISAAGTTAAVEDGLVGALLSGLTGGALDVSLIGWEGLAQAGITLADLGTELGELGVDVGAGTLAELLDVEVTAGQLGRAIVGALEAGGDTAGLDSTLLGALAVLDIPALPAFALGELLAVSTSAEAALATQVDALGLLVAGLQLANHRAAIAIDLELPGLTGVRLTVIEPPNIAIGPPGYHGDGEPRTQARSAQLGLDIQLPGLLTVASGDRPTSITAEITDQVQPFRDDIDQIDDCYEALFEASAASGTLRSRMEAAIEELNDAAQAAGLGSVVSGLVGVVEGLLGGLLGGLGCLVAPTSTRNSIRNRLHGIADVYRDMLIALAAESEEGAPAVAGSPAALSLRLAQATHTLEAVSCGGEGEAIGAVTGEAASLRSTVWSDTYEQTPAGAVVQLLDVDVGLLRASVGFAIDTPLGHSVSETVAFGGPFPTHHRQGADAAGVASLVDVLEPTTTIDLFGLPLGGVVDGLIVQARDLLRPVLAGLDDVLVPLLDVLGAELGGVDASVLSARCTGRTLVR